LYKGRREIERKKRHMREIGEIGGAEEGMKLVRDGIEATAVRSL